MRKSILFAVVVSTLSCGLVSAGDGKISAVPEATLAPIGCACFEPGFEFSGFGAGILPDHGDGDALGGGVSFGYFFTEYIGAEFSYTALATDPSAEHLVTGHLILRYPMKELCIAPYILAGGGLLTNSETDGLFDAGGGIDIRMESWGCVGIFADATYNWAQDDREFTLIRTGFRIPF